MRKWGAERGKMRRGASEPQETAKDRRIVFPSRNCPRPSLPLFAYIHMDAKRRSMISTAVSMNTIR